MKLFRVRKVLEDVYYLAYRTGRSKKYPNDTIAFARDKEKIERLIEEARNF